ncbi:hypothetical protein RhiirA1_473118 [Rhizophagus irregularis]|uniref:Uncharacterized protein n=1 Tax=Rhizophagus irregularis TaxID=588596 RepID=A0A2N0R164_9GLOM|nr:hypothetical protein RhiirA1_473118 [Rhizophagus irregularis]
MFNKTITGIPASCAILQIASKSGILNFGFLIDSRYIAFTVGTTKWIGGHGTTIGSVVIDEGDANVGATFTDTLQLAS